MSTTSNPKAVLRPVKPGIRFHNGRLLVFDARSVTVVRPWPELRAWRKLVRRGAWRPVRPEIDFNTGFVASPYTRRLKTRIRYQTGLAGEEPSAQPEVAEPEDPELIQWRQWSLLRQAQERQAGARFLASMPDETRSAVGAYQNRQWHVASMILRCPVSPDLVGSNPALAYCLASAWVFRPQGMSWPMRSIRRILPKRRREIAGWLGFPATDAAVNILAKVPASACSIQRLLGLRTALTDATSSKWLSHAAVLHGPVLDLLTQRWFSQPCTPPFIREAARNWTTQDEGVRGMALLGDTFWMARRLGEIGRLRISSLRGLIREHDRLAVMERRRIRQEEDRAFPAPPLRGSPTIVPIRSVSELVREGEEQENCVAGYAHAVLQGRCFLYRVLAPERATLSLVNDGQQWRLGELALKQNGMSCGTTGQAVENWLQASSMCAVDADLSPC